MTSSKIQEHGSRHCWEYPLGYCITYQWQIFTQYKIVYFIGSVLFHVAPAIFIDLLLRLMGKNPMLMKLARRIYNANNALTYFAFNEWKFVNKKGQELRKELCGPDVKMFGYSVADVDIDTFMYYAVRGVRKFLLKRNEDSLENEKLYTKCMYLLNLAALTILAVLLLQYVYHMFDA